MTDTIVNSIKDILRSEFSEIIPRIANKSLSFHELEAIFFNQGNGFKLFTEEGNDEAAWDTLSSKDKNKWNTKAKKEAKEALGTCGASRKDGSNCTTQATVNGYCGKHKNYANSQKLAEEIAFKAPEEEKPVMKRKKINGKYYLVDAENRVFTPNEKELIGVFNPDTKNIEQGDDQFDNSSINESDSEEEIIDSDNESNN